MKTAINKRILSDFFQNEDCCHRISSHAKLITCPIELKPLRGNDRHV
ncbi:hypothetical protein VL20_5403 [Microcystis panniformis FACHB-1757]|uniref:Uncharacterized protein n=1 Tax=Microcystis panniformis FACHB-1757 TaxID=1638788 RepID=A0A0K1S891_9CHRO|nr:hypothetical protein VL20_5403 [Microcystis panniformis FACHB-1757]